MGPNVGDGFDGRDWDDDRGLSALPALPHVDDGLAGAALAVAHDAASPAQPAAGATEAVQAALPMADNNVVVVGTLGTLRERGKDRLVGSGRSRLGGDLSRLRLQVVDGVGEPYALPLELPHAYYARGIGQTALDEGARVRIEGRLEWRTTIDRSLVDVSDPDDFGRQLRELALMVTSVTLASDEDVDGSWVRCRGVVLDPPQIRAHPVEQSLLVAMGAIAVEEHRPSPIPGSRVVDVIRTTVPFDLPLALAGAGAALRKGNEVYVEGRLSRQVNRLAAPDAYEQAAFAKLNDEMAAALELPPAQQRTRQREIMNRRARLLFPFKLRVRIGHCELLRGTPAAPREAQRLREEWIRSLKSSSRRNGARQAQRGTQRPHDDRLSPATGDVTEPASFQAMPSPPPAAVDADGADAPIDSGDVTAEAAGSAGANQRLVEAVPKRNRRRVVAVLPDADGSGPDLTTNGTADGAISTMVVVAEQPAVPNGDMPAVVGTEHSDVRLSDADQPAESTAMVELADGGDEPVA